MYVTLADLGQPIRKPANQQAFLVPPPFLSGAVDDKIANLETEIARIGILKTKAMQAGQAITAEKFREAMVAMVQELNTLKGQRKLAAAGNGPVGAPGNGLPTLAMAGIGLGVLGLGAWALLRWGPRAKQRSL